MEIFVLTLFRYLLKILPHSLVHSQCKININIKVREAAKHQNTLHIHAPNTVIQKDQ